MLGITVILKSAHLILMHHVWRALLTKMEKNDATSLEKHLPSIIFKKMKTGMSLLHSSVLFMMKSLL